MDYYYDWNLSKYLEENLIKVFSRKEIKKHGRECLQQIKELFLMFKEELQIENEKNFAYLFIHSFPVYQELKELNPELRKQDERKILFIYLSARCYADTHVFQLSKDFEGQLQVYYEKIGRFIQPKDTISRNLTYLAFYNTILESQNIGNISSKKDLIKLDPEMRRLVIERNKRKALIH